MAKKIIKGIGSALGIKKKKKAPEPEPEGPKITQLTAEDKKKLPASRARGGRFGTILSDTLGGASAKLGG